MSNPRFYNVTKEKTFRAPPMRDESLDFSFHATAEPGVWRVKTEREEFFVTGESRSASYVEAASKVHNCANPIKPEYE